MCYIIFVGRETNRLNLDNRTMPFSHKNPMTNKVWTRDELYNSLQEMRRERDDLLLALPSTNVSDDSVINTDVLKRKISEANQKIGTFLRQLDNRALQLAARRAVR